MSIIDMKLHFLIILKDPSDMSSVKYCMKRSDIIEEKLFSLLLEVDDYREVKSIIYNIEHTLGKGHTIYEISYSFEYKGKLLTDIFGEFNWKSDEVECNDMILLRNVNLEDRLIKGNGMLMYGFPLVLFADDNRVVLHNAHSISGFHVDKAIKDMFVPKLEMKIKKDGFLDKCRIIK